MDQGSCGFCGSFGDLEESHVLPAFLYRWLRQRGAGHIRNTETPNRRVQDGLKFPWLCRDCEARFSRYETAFATKLFHPWQKGCEPVEYEDWLLKFCVSVSWRVLKYARGQNPNAPYSAKQSKLADEAERKWRAYLEGSTPGVGKFEQHLLYFDLIESTNVDLPRNINRFLTGQITLDIVGSDCSVMTFAKLGPFMLFGMIQKGSNAWEGTKIFGQHGVFKTGDFVIPKGLIPLLHEKAGLADAAMEALSPAQRAKIQDNILRNLDKFQGSPQHRAMEADAQMFGIDAILSP